jgi:hypothetical protein
MALLGKLFWIVLTLVFTFAFVVLFEHGIDNFADSAQLEFKNVKTLFSTETVKPKSPGTP